MPLLRRLNGNNTDNLVKASWWNDFLDLFTGIMQDQFIKVKNNVTLQAIGDAPASAPSTTLSAGGSLGVGTYKWAVTFVSEDGGESLPSPVATSSTTSGNQTMIVSLPLGPVGTDARNIYRTLLNGTQLYWLGRIGNNTQTTYTDRWPDGNLIQSRPAPTHSTFGGSLFIKDATGNTSLTIANDGALIGSGGNTSFGSTSINGNLTVTGDVIGNGRLGRTVAGDVIDASTRDTYIKSRNVSGTNGNIYFQVPNGSTIGSVDANGLNFSTKGATFDNVTITGPSNLRIRPDVTSAASIIAVSQKGLGVKINGGRRLFQAKADGNFIIDGSTYYTNQSTIFYTASGSFDGFDLAECYAVDAEYEVGTLLCPADVDTIIPYKVDPTFIERLVPMLTRCTHDRCNLAGIVVTQPGYCMGSPNLPSKEYYNPERPTTQPIALAGRVFARTAFEITPRSYVCSDGRGGVRALLPGESAFALGVTLSPTDAGLVPLLVRPTFVTLESPVE